MALNPIGTGIRKFTKIRRMALHDYASTVTEDTAVGSYADYAVGRYIPAIINDSIDFSGDDASLETLKAIDGSTISSYTSDPATFSIDFLTADLEEDLLVALTGLDASKITGVASVAIFGESGAGTSVALNISGNIKTAVSLISEDGLAVLFIPNAQIVTSLSYSDNHIVISGTINALSYDKGSLGDVNILHSSSSAAIGSSLTLPAGTYTVESPIEVIEAPNSTPSTSSKSSNKNSL